MSDRFRYIGRFLEDLSSDHHGRGEGRGYWRILGPRSLEMQTSYRVTAASVVARSSESFGKPASCWIFGRRRGCDDVVEVGVIDERGSHLIHSTTVISTSGEVALTLARDESFKRWRKLLHIASPISYCDLACSSTEPSRTPYQGVWISVVAAVGMEGDCDSLVVLVVDCENES